MTATFHDSALAGDGGPVTILPCADALAVTAGDTVWVHVKCETPAATCTVDTGASTPTFSTANAKHTHTDGGHWAQTLYWVATSTGTVTPRVVFSQNVDFATIRAIGVTPAGGTVLVLGNTAVADGESTTPSSGAASAVAAGASFAGFAMFGSVTYTEGSGWTEPAEFEGSVAAHAAYQLQTGAGSLTANGTIGTQDWIATLDIFDEEAAADLEQEGFRWGVDDGSESAHGWEAAQDTDITIAANQSRLLRVLIDTPDDPTALAYTLRVQKNGSGGYVVVPVGATVPETPATVVAVAATSTANPTTTFPITVPTVEVDDLLEVTFISRDHTSGTAHPTVTDDQSGSPGWTQAGFSDNRQVHVFYRRATAGVTGATITVAGCVGSSCGALRVIRGVLASGNPFTDFVWEENASGNEAHAAFTPSNANSLVNFIVANDTNDTLTVSSMAAATLGTFEPEDYNDLSTGGSDCAIYVSGRGQSGAAADTGAFSWSQTNAATISGTYAIRPKAAVNNEVYITTSANIAAGGEATTARLTAPSGKTTSDFVTGRRWDDENGTDTIDITANDYSEFEWLVALSSAPANDDFFDFRVYIGETALSTYTLTPRWTVPSAGQNINAGLSTETDSAFSIGRLKTRVVGLNTETDSVLALTRRKSVTLGLNTETDSAFALANRLKSKAVGLVQEDDTALPLQLGSEVAVGLAAETDSALAAGRLKQFLIGLTSEADSALAVGRAKSLAVGLNSEANSALSITPTRTIPVGLATETDSVFSLARLKSLAIGLAIEVDSALGIEGFFEAIVRRRLRRGSFRGTIKLSGR